MTREKIKEQQRELKARRIKDIKENKPVEEVENIAIKKAKYPFLYMGIYLNRLIGNRKINVRKSMPDSKGRPIIFAPTHIGKYDVEIIAEKIKKHFLLLSGDYENLHPDIGGKMLEQNGIIYFDMDDKEDRKNVKIVIDEVLSSNLNIMWFPEGTWEFSENEIILPCYYQIIESAIKNNALILPIAIEQYGKEFEINFGTFFDPKSYVDGVPTKEEKKSLIKELRNIMATLKYEIWLTKDATSLDDFLNQQWEEFVNEKLRGQGLEKLEQEWEQIKNNLVKIWRDSLKEEWEEYIEDRLKEWPGFTYEDVISKRFVDKDVITNENAFGHMNNVEVYGKTAFLYNKKHTGIK